MRKKFWLFTMTGFMAAAAITGCSAQENAGESAAASEAGTDGQVTEEAQSEGTEEKAGKLTLVLRAGSYTDVMKNLAPAFAEEHNCEFEFLDLDFTDMYQKIALDSQNKEGTYDVLMIDGSWLSEFLENGIIVNLTDMGYSLDEDFIQKATEGGMDDSGNVYGIPFYGNVMVQFYNKQVLSDLGYETTPDTWEGILEVAKKAKEAGKEGYLLRAQAGENILTDIHPILLAHGGQVLDENNNVTIDTPEFKAALEFYMTLKEYGTIMDKDDIVASVQSGNGAMSLDWPGWYTPLGDDSSAFNLIPRKVGADDPEYPSSIYGLWYLGIPENSQNKELALEFIKYITDAEQQTASVQYGGVPTRTSVYENPDIIAQSPNLQYVYETLKEAVYRPRIKEWTEITVTLGTELDNAVQGVKSAEDALRDAQAACEAIMGN